MVGYLSDPSLGYGPDTAEGRATVAAQSTMIFERRFGRATEAGWPPPSSPQNVSVLPTATATAMVTATAAWAVVTPGPPWDYPPLETSTPSPFDTPTDLPPKLRGPIDPAYPTAPPVEVTPRAGWP